MHKNLQHAVTNRIRWMSTKNYHDLTTNIILSKFQTITGNINFYIVDWNIFPKLTNIESIIILDPLIKFKIPSGFCTKISVLRFSLLEIEMTLLISLEIKQWRCIASLSKSFRYSKNKLPLSEIIFTIFSCFNLYLELWLFHPKKSFNSVSNNETFAELAFETAFLKWTKSYI